MALDHKALQKKRVKRAQKRQQTKLKSGGISGILHVVREWASVSQSPIADVLVPTNLFEEGIGTVWISRQLPDGRYAIAGFLVDVLCLGVKNALHKILDAAEYPGFLASIHSSTGESMERQHPSCARKLVEGALAYAKDLGFEPHADYRIARLIFGDIEADACPLSFTFGRDGKPCYISGPHDTPAFQRRILKQLEQHRGPGGYDALIISDPHTLI